jgi:hypothetical protein
MSDDKKPEEPKPQTSDPNKTEWAKQLACEDKRRRDAGLMPCHRSPSS